MISKPFESEADMVNLSLTTEEAQLLKVEVKMRITALDDEIAHSDSLDYKAMLKHRRAAIQNFLEKLSGASAMAA